MDSKLLQQARQLQQAMAMRANFIKGPDQRAVAGTPTSPLGAFVRSGTEGLIDNAIGLPNLALTAGANLLDRGAKNAAIGYSALTGNFGPAAQKIMSNTPPEIGDRVLPFGSEHVMAAGQRLGESAAAVRNMDFSQFQPSAVENQRRISESTAEQFPTASALGQVAADVATIGLMRAPIAGLRSMAHLSAAERANAIRAAASAAKDSGTLTGWRYAENIPEAVKALTVNSAGFGNLMNLAGRAAETGIEGAILGALHDGDPLQMGMFSAGAQAGSSLLLGGLGGLVGRGLGTTGLNIAAAAAGVGAIWQTMKSAVPGGKDFILESLESGFNKVALAAAAGMIAGAAGLGRLPVKSLPAVSDYFTSIPRAAMLSVIEDMANEPPVEMVMSKMKTDPFYFGQGAARQIERAFRNPDVSLAGVVKDLMKNPEFASKFAELEKAQ